MLKYRTISGCLIGGALVLAAYTLPTPGVWILLIAVSSAAQLEAYGMMRRAGIPVFRILGVICGAALITATMCTIGPNPENMLSAYKWETIVLLATLMAVFIRQFPQKHNDKPMTTIACTLLGVWYVPFLFNFFTRLAYMWDGAESSIKVGETGRLLVLYLVVVVKMADIGAYFVGKLFGKHKLFLRISPAKTWEGMFGGMAAGLGASFAFCALTGFHLGEVHMGIVHATALGLLLSLAGTTGDMFESLIKRASGIKDSGTVIPGLGGFLDVLDSLLFGAPLLYVYVRIFSLTAI